MTRLRGVAFQPSHRTVAEVTLRRGEGKPHDRGGLHVVVAAFKRHKSCKDGAHRSLSSLMQGSTCLPSQYGRQACGPSFRGIVAKLSRFVIFLTMRTISQAVEEIIQRTPFLAETMAEGIANNAQIARRIRPDVEKRLYEKVSEAAIAMALHRIGKKAPQNLYSAKLVKKMNDLTVRSNLVEFVCANSEALPRVLETLSKS